MPKTTNKIWTKEEDRFLIDNYAQFKGPIRDFAKIMNRTPDSISGRASLLKIKKPKALRGATTYKINEYFFEKIDTHEKAYWYGFIWADGSIYKSNFELALQERDLYIIEAFKTTIQSTHPIKKHKKYNTFRFCFANKNIVQILEKLNITERKSYSPLTPKIEDEFFFSFLLGLFDGDGNVTGAGGLRITTSPEVGIWIQEMIYRLSNINLSIYPIKNCHAIRADLNKQKDSSILFNLMYQNISFFLKRKLEKIIDFRSIRNIECAELERVLGLWPMPIK